MEVKIPKLTASDIEVRVQQVGKSFKGNNVYAKLLLYKNARIDMQILDNVFGVLGWQRRHKEISGKLYCTVSIYDKTNHIWVDKEDVGVSNQANLEVSKQRNAEKTEASDSFKRACVNVGIGRELYTAPKIYVTLNNNEYEVKSQGGKTKYTTKPSRSFSVGSIGYNERGEINELTIIDNKNRIRFTY